jgi:hypothetical protein
MPPDDTGPTPRDTTEPPDDTSPDTSRDGGGGGPDRPFTVQTCGDLQPPSGNGVCRVEPGNSEQIVVRGDILTTDTVYEGGSVRIDPTTGGDEGTGTIQCTGCDCQSSVQEQPTVVTCADAVVSPGLINPHDHLGWGTYGPKAHEGIRYDHRHDWRVGARGHDAIETPDSDFSRKGILHGELRHLFGGATSIAGSTRGTTPQGLLRNLDTPESDGGLEASVEYSTFPLGDVSGRLKTSGCDYGRTDSASALRTHDIYLPHVSEGIDPEARNEFSCLSKSDGDGDALIGPNTSIIHGIGMTAEDIRDFSDSGKALVWSPRTNVSLYGHTAPIATYDFFDVPIALGTDWSISGSRNMLRELTCADTLSDTYYDDRFSDYRLWKMATYNGAVALGVEDQLGDLKKGYAADLAIFADNGSSRYNAVVDARDEDVALVMRGGEPLYGRTSIVEGLLSSDEVKKCGELDVCGTTRRVCVERDTADNADGSVDLTTLRAEAGDDSYPMFSCNDPISIEPTCTPSRPKGGEGDDYAYRGMSSMSDRDGDGVPNGEDNCPSYFNPGQPLDGSNEPLDQADADGDGVGDVCDPCPTSADDLCSREDWDGDGVRNPVDNCPHTANPGQADEDGDATGDDCDLSATPYDLDTNAVLPGDKVQLDRLVVTAVDSDTPGIYVQMPPDDPRFEGVEGSGTYVYLGSDPLPERGDLVTLRGHLEFFYELPQISNVTSLTIHSGDPEMPEPKILADPCAIATGGTRADALRGALVRVENVTVQTEPNSDGEFRVGPSCSDGRLLVDSTLYGDLPDQVAKGDELDFIAGTLHFAFDESRLRPRDVDDVGFGPAPIESIEPDRTSLPAQTNQSPPAPPVTVELARKSSSDTTIQLDYPDSAMLSGPSTMTIPKGQTEAELPALDGKQASNSRQDRAKIELTGPSGQPRTVEVLVYDDQLFRTIDDMTAQPSVAEKNESVQVTLTLDIPAKIGGQTVWLSSSSDLDLRRNQRQVPGGQRKTTFTIGAGSQVGRKTLEARVGSNRETVTITTVDPSRKKCLIVSEYIEGSGYRNKAIELFNCGGSTLDLSKYGICLVSNSNTTCGSTEGLASTSLKPFDVHTVCKDKSRRSSGDPVVEIRNNCDQASSGVMGFNGNDRLIVFRDGNDDGSYQSSSDEITDAFGRPSSEPSGTPWKDVTYRRCRYAPYKGSRPFDVTSYYQSFPTDNADDYGKAPPVRGSGCP